MAQTIEDFLKRNIGKYVVLYADVMLVTELEGHFLHYKNRIQPNAGYTNCLEANLFTENHLRAVKEHFASGSYSPEGCMEMHFGYPNTWQGLNNHYQKQLRDIFGS